MKNKKKYFMVLFIAATAVLAACGNTMDQSRAESDNQSSNTPLTHDADDNREGSLANSNSEGTDNSKQTDQKEASDHPFANSNVRESLKSSDRDGELTESRKADYLRKLNEMEESDRNEEAKTTTVEMKEQETERYKTWDEALNEIYGVVREQLSTVQMDKLRDEQQKWIQHRDEKAKEASLKYKGGSMESLEYVATQVSLTRERCYALVANYMN